MAARLYTSSFFFIALVVALVVASFYTCAAEATPRLIVIPGKLAIILMEGVSPAGQDPDPQRLWDAIAMPPIHRPEGDGKVMATSANEFTLTCAVRDHVVHTVACTISVKPSDKSKIDFRRVSYQTEGADAQMLNQTLAGSRGTFSFETANHGLKIESTPEHFDFSYQQ